MPRRPGTRDAPTPPELPPVHFARDWLRSEVTANVRAGRWIRVRHGAYIDHATDEAPHARALRIALARIAAVAELSGDHVISHTSAALLWGLPVLRTPTRTHVVSRAHPSGRSRDLVGHVLELADSDVTLLAGRRVTTLERTVVDCAMAHGGHTGLIVADAALRAGASLDACREVAQRLAGRRGVIAARAVLDFADDGAESAGESSTRFALLRAGLPRSETQVRTDTRLGAFWSDMGWPEWAVLLEYDGRTKYEATGRASDAVLKEKRRQDAIEETGRRVLRVVAADLRDPAALASRVLRAARLHPGPLRPRRELTLGPATSAS